MQKIADKEAEEQGKPDLRSRERIKQDTEDDMAAQGLPRNFEEYAKQMPKPAEGRKPWGGRFKLPGQGEQTTTTQPVNPPATAPKTPDAVAEETRQQLGQLDLPPQKKALAQNMIDSTQKLLAKPGGYKALTDDEKFVVDNNRDQLKQLLGAAKPVAPASAAPQPAQDAWAKFNKGELLTTDDVAALGSWIKGKAQQANQGELVTSADLGLPGEKAKSAFDRFTRGELVTTGDVKEVGRKFLAAIQSASPFRRYAGFRK